MHTESYQKIIHNYNNHIIFSVYHVHRYLANYVHSDCSKLVLHGNLGLSISQRPKFLQKLVHTFIEDWNETFEVAIISTTANITDH